MTKKLSITRCQAILDTKKIWKSVDDGKAAADKIDALILIRRNEPDFYKKLYNMRCLCPLCEYTQSKIGVSRSLSEGCRKYCPIVLKFNTHCYDGATSYKIIPRPLPH